MAPATENVAHGKTTLIKALTGKVTLAHSEELKRGITIRLGYADATIYKCKCGLRTTTPKCPSCLAEAEPERAISFVDAPGHETLMATVLCGASLLDGAILVIAANEKCPQPQTREHVAVLEAIGIKNVVIVQNKVDLVSKEEALENLRQIEEFVRGTFLEAAPIIPVSAQQGINLEFLLDAIQEKIPTPTRDPGKDPYMLVARSFDINKPGISAKALKGGVLGGALIQGKLKLGDEIEIRPGVKVKEKYESLPTSVEGLQKAGMDLEEAGPGGLLGVLTKLDPSLTKSDLLVGNVVGLPGKLPETTKSLCLDFKLLERVVGAKELLKVEPIKQGENLLLNVGTSRTLAQVKKISKGILELELKIPVCVRKGERAAVSRQVAGRWRLIGYGKIL